VRPDCAGASYSVATRLPDASKTASSACPASWSSWNVSCALPEVGFGRGGCRVIEETPTSTSTSASTGSTPSVMVVEPLETRYVVVVKAVA